MKQSESINELIKALCLFQSKARAPEKTGMNAAFRSRYSTIGDLLSSIKSELRECGLAFTQEAITEIEAGKVAFVSVSTILMHVSGQYLQFEPLKLPVKDSTAHGCGGAITYARRYALNAALGLDGEPDDDGNLASCKPDFNGQTPAPRQEKISPQAAEKIHSYLQENVFAMSEFLKFGVSHPSMLTNDQADQLRAILQKNKGNRDEN